MLYYAENFSENNALDWFEDIKQPIFCDKNYFSTDQRVVSRSSQPPARIEMYKQLCGNLFSDHFQQFLLCQNRTR